MSKVELREQLKQTRSEIPVPVRKRYDGLIREKVLSLPEIEQADTIFCFISFDTEVDTHNLIKSLQVQGKNLLVPRTATGRKMMPVLLDSWDDLVEDDFGILVPRVSGAFGDEIDVCLTPGLGFNRSGYRLGYGAGFYDVWFNENPVRHKIGIAYDCQVIDDIPVEEFDIPVDRIITEKNIYDTGMKR